MLFRQLLEVDSKPVDINWFYKKNSEWYGTFAIDGIEYNISFSREDIKYNLPVKVISLKFSRPDLVNPYAFSKDFNKPLVVKNTVLEALKTYILTEKIEMFIIKAYTKESTRVKKYRALAHSLVRDFGFIFDDEIVYKEYTYFMLLRNKQIFLDREQILNQVINSK